jgi:hypothetical protein
VTSFDFPQLFCIDHICHGTAGIGIRKQHGLIRAQYGCGLSHKMYAAKNDHISVSLRSFLAQLKRITQKVSAILHLWRLIVMTEDYCVAFSFKFINLLDYFFIPIGCQIKTPFKINL